MHIYGYSAVFSQGSPQEYAAHGSATQVSTLSSKYPTAVVNMAPIGSREGSGWMLLPLFPVEMLQGRSSTYIFQAAHEVVADWRARQVGRVQAAPDVEEVIGAQHGVVLLSVAGGGEDAIHQDGDLEGSMGSRAQGER